MLQQRAIMMWKYNVWTFWNKNMDFSSWWLLFFKLNTNTRSFFVMILRNAFLRRATAKKIFFWGFINAHSHTKSLLYEFSPSALLSFCHFRAATKKHSLADSWRSSHRNERSVRLFCGHIKYSRKSNTAIWLKKLRSQKMKKAPTLSLLAKDFL